MKRIIPALLTGIIILINLSARAQSDSVKTSGWFKHLTAGAAQIQVTYRTTDLKQLNSALTNSGFAPLGHNDIWINASMSHIHGNWLFEDGIGFTPFTTSDMNDLKAQFNQYQLYTRAAYNISNNSDFRFFPFVGLNFSAAVLNIQDKKTINSTSDFSGELAQSSLDKTLYQPNFGIELGAGFDYLIKVKPKNMGCFQLERNIPIGLRAGYYINAAQGDWRIDGHDLTTGPDKKQNAVFVSVNIGLGYAIKK